MKSPKASTRARIVLVLFALLLLQPTASLQTRVINGGRIQVGANQVADYVQQTTTLTDAQIKALPTTPITLVAAPGAGLSIEPLFLVLYAKTSAGAYTNLDAAGYLGTDHSAGVSWVPNDTSITAGSATRLSDLLGSTTPHSVRLLPYQDTEGTHAHGFVTVVTDTSFQLNAALHLTLENHASGNLTGGNAANTLQVTVIFRVLATTAPLTVTCPANVSTTSSDGSAVAVTYAAPTITGGTGVTGSYDTASGSSFSPGTTSSVTTVTYTASSTDGQSGTCSFTVSVGNVAAVASGAYYVSRTGTDSVSCAQAKTITTPKQTLNAAVACLAAGDTLYVRGGTYPESLLHVIPSGTSWAATVRITAYPGETVTLRPTSGDFVLDIAGSSNGGNTGVSQYIDLDGLTIDGTAGIGYSVIKIESGPGYAAHHIRIQRCTILNNPTDHIPSAILVTGLVSTAIGFNEFLSNDVSGGHPDVVGNDFSNMLYIQTGDNLIDGNTIHDGIGAAVQLFNSNVGGSRPDRNIVRNNVIRDFTMSPLTRADGVILEGDANQVYNNLITNFAHTDARNASGAIQVFGGDGNLVYHNTLYGSTIVGLYLAAGTNTIARNNISYGNSVDYTNAGTGTTASTNVIGVDPLFVNAGAGNFRLQALSPALDLATIALVTTDIEGITRPQGAASDAGAYEKH